MNKELNDVDAYIASFPSELQDRLQKIRQTIRKAAPAAEESISYGIAAYKYNGPLVYFAGFKNHIGFYPVPSGVKAFKKELEPYLASKATARFLHTETIPLELVARIVKFRVEENSLKAGNKTDQDFLPKLSAPARRALEEKGIKTVSQLAKHSRSELMSLHGIGPTSLLTLEKALAKSGKKFKTK